MHKGERYAINNHYNEIHLNVCVISTIYFAIMADNNQFSNC